MPTAFRVDSHHHFWDPTAFHYPWMEGDAIAPIRRSFGTEDLVPALNRNDIDGTVLVQTVSDVSETRQFLQTATETTWVKGVVGWVDLTSASVGDALDELLESFPGLLVGIRHQVHDEDDPNWLLRPDVRRGLEAVSARGLRYDLLVRTRELPAAITTVRNFSELGFVLDHIAKPPIAEGWSKKWAELIAELASHTNTSVKLSGMVTEASWSNWDARTLHPYIDHVLGSFTPARAMFGSDWPVCLLAADSYDDVIGALEANTMGLSESEQAGVFGENAATFYKLQAMGAE
jgi:L-fuconolactonase